MTSLEAVEAAIIALKDYTSHIYVGDSDSGGYNPFSMHEVYGEIGMYELGQAATASRSSTSATCPVGRWPSAAGGPLSVDLPRSADRRDRPARHACRYRRST